MYFKRRQNSMMFNSWLHLKVTDCAWHANFGFVLNKMANLAIASNPIKNRESQSPHTYIQSIIVRYHSDIAFVSAPAFKNVFVCNGFSLVASTITFWCYFSQQHFIQDTMKHQLDILHKTYAEITTFMLHIKVDCPSLPKIREHLLSTMQKPLTGNKPFN